MYSTRESASYSAISLAETLINVSCLQEVGHIVHHQLYVTVPEIRSFCNYDLHVLPCVAKTRTLKQLLMFFAAVSLISHEWVARYSFCAPLGLHFLRAHYLLRFWQFLQKSEVSFISSLTHPLSDCPDVTLMPDFLATLRVEPNFPQSLSKFSHFTWF
jgi:hypothetical protein